MAIFCMFVYAMWNTFYYKNAGAALLNKWRFHSYSFLRKHVDVTLLPAPGGQRIKGGTGTVPWPPSCFWTMPCNLHLKTMDREQIGSFRREKTIMYYEIWSDERKIWSKTSDVLFRCEKTESKTQGIEARINIIKRLFIKLCFHVMQFLLYSLFYYLLFLLTIC